MSTSERLSERVDEVATPCQEGILTDKFTNVGAQLGQASLVFGSTRGQLSRIDAERKQKLNDWKVDLTTPSHCRRVESPSLDISCPLNQLQPRLRRDLVLNRHRQRRAGPASIVRP